MKELIKRSEEDYVDFRQARNEMFFFPCWMLAFAVALLTLFMCMCVSKRMSIPSIVRPGVRISAFETVLWRKVSKEEPEDRQGPKDLCPRAAEVKTSKGSPNRCSLCSTGSKHSDDARPAIVGHSVKGWGVRWQRRSQDCTNKGKRGHRDIHQHQGPWGAFQHLLILH